MASSVEITNPFLNERSSEPTFHSIADYVERLGGTKVVDTILIANNGIAAVKVISTISFSLVSHEIKTSNLNSVLRKGEIVCSSILSR